MMTGVLKAPQSWLSGRAMRNTVVTAAVIFLIWLGYVAWPIFDLLRLVRGVETRNAATVTQFVNFRAVRASLTRQISDAYIRRTGTQISPIAQSAVAAISIADPIVAKLVSVEALAELLRVGWPASVVTEPPPPDAIGLSSNALGNLWQIFTLSDYGIARYEIAVPASSPPQHRFGLGFRVTQWRWQLSSVVLPMRIQDMLADELIRMLKTPPQSR
jgi:hypothetical protein